LLRAEIVVNAPIEVVFKAIADINHWPQWPRNVNNAHIEGSTEAGNIFQLESQRLYHKIKAAHSKAPFRDRMDRINMVDKSHTQWQIHTEW
jgi:hypothetical protein